MKTEQKRNGRKMERNWKRCENAVPRKRSHRRTIVNFLLTGTSCYVFAHVTVWQAVPASDATCTTVCTERASWHGYVVSLVFPWDWVSLVSRLPLRTSRLPAPTSLSCLSLSLLPGPAPTRNLVVYLLFFVTRGHYNLVEAENSAEPPAIREAPSTWPWNTQSVNGC